MGQNSQLELIEGTNRDAGLSQWFTPPKLAARVVEWAGVPISPFKEWRVLEPSAGNGALVRPLLAAGAEVYAVEVDDRYFGDLALLGANDREDRLEFGIGDFLARLTSSS